MGGIIVLAYGIDKNILNVHNRANCQLFMDKLHLNQNREIKYNQETTKFNTMQCKFNIYGTAVL